MDVPAVLTAMAEVIRSVPGVKSAHYPAPNSLSANNCPAVVMYWGGTDETMVSDLNVSSGTMWQPSVMAQILIPRSGDTPQEFASVDALITPIVDAFARPTAEIPALAGKVHRCHATRIRSSLQLDYAGSAYYVAEINFDIKFHRRKTP